MFRRTSLLVLSFCVSLIFSNLASAVETLKWQDLAPPLGDIKNPIMALSNAQRNNLSVILWGPNFKDTTGKMNEEESKARESLIASGIDPDAIVAELKALIEKARQRDETLVEELNGRDIRIPGYVLPLEFSGTLVKKFLLVPDVGACIHVPPPPPNQIINVAISDGFESKGLFTPVWVSGRITTGKTEENLTLVDGTSKVSVGYSIEATKIVPYQK
jgi:hypothetical protein